MQVHQFQEINCQPPNVTFSNEWNNSNEEMLLSFKGEKQQDFDNQPIQLQIAKKYLSLSSALLTDVLDGGIQTLYTLEENQSIPKAYLLLLQNPRKTGCKLARNSSGNQTFNIILQTEVTETDVIHMLYGYSLASYKWNMKTKKTETIENKVRVGPIKEQRQVNIIHKTITEQSLLQTTQTNPGLRLYIKFIYLYESTNLLPSHILQLRHLANSRANFTTTTFMLEHIRKIQEILGDQVKLTQYVGEELLKKGLNLIHAVGRASKYPPALACLSYQGSEPNSPYLALIGKGVVFDSGGLSIKGSSSMETMYDDKTGACTVLEAFKAIVQLGLKLNVVCTVALVENSISGDAYRVSDIIQSYKGLTVEINNTDAEGRLILADAMSYTQDHFKVGTMIELSTLTSAIRTAVGAERAGLFTNTERFVNKMKTLSEFTEEGFWHMPIFEEHRSQMRTYSADLTNSGGRNGGASCAAAFLENFVEKGVKWMHWDIATMALASSDNYINNKGATGFGLQQLVYFAAAKAKFLGQKFYQDNKKFKSSKMNKPQKVIQQKQQQEESKEEIPKE